jgi:uncharacterized low-complexity protein
MKNKMSISALVGAAFVASAALSPLTMASSSDLTANKLSSGYTLADKTEGKCGEAKCGADKKKEGSCGGDKKKEGSCGGDKKKSDEEGKCGEGKCGADKKKADDEKAE